ncbi:hypothetical protein B0H67DRAFT_584101 [Lasiosphaeris hirsuta]|uniref:NAD(P)-binding protein n=1 Tax=Lasiosphaeris hirsuta TaxID=260670 RepID=A0AA40DPR4_9PEZI|nr:hypothetical protein B0H67DRAFT_584101 [Lasiosphaeris hirsuta]
MGIKTPLYQSTIQLRFIFILHVFISESAKKQLHFLSCLTYCPIDYHFTMSNFLSMMRVTLFGARNKSEFNPARDIPSLKDKVIVVTGGASGLGEATVAELLRHDPARIYIADLPRPAEDVAALIASHATPADADADADADTDETATEIKFLDLDLGSFESVQRAAATLAGERIDILVLNAGIMPVKPRMTAEGYEAAFGVNYLGHALLARLLVPVLLKTVEIQPDVRIVIVSSEGHAMAPKGGIDFDQIKTACEGMSFTKRYGQSKVASIGLAKELGERYPSLKVAAVHPGRISTNMGKALQEESYLIRLLKPLESLICVTPEVGVENHLWAATSPDVVSGKYYLPVGIVDDATIMNKDVGLSKKLWDWTETELKDRL